MEMLDLTIYVRKRDNLHIILDLVPLTVRRPRMPPYLFFRPRLSSLFFTHLGLVLL